jgi:glutamate dehydrogenase
LSLSLITLQNDLEESNLYDDLVLRSAVLSKAIPKALLEQVGLKTMMARLPEIYSRSIFSSFVASVSFAFRFPCAY